MRILLASRNFFPRGIVGGAQVSIKYLASALMDGGHQVAVLSIDGDRTSSGVNPEMGIQEYRIKLRNVYEQGRASAPKRLLWHAIDRFGHLMDDDYCKVIEDFRPDVINTNVMAGLGLGIWRAAEASAVPVVHTVHDYYLVCLKSGMRKGRDNCKTPCSECRATAVLPSRNLSNRIAGAVFVSDHMRNAHHNAGVLRTGNASIIHGAYSPANSISLPEESATLRLGYFGRLAPDKGLNLLIAALKAASGFKWELTVGGSGDPEFVSRLKAQAVGLPINFAGVLKPHDFYSRVDAVIISSLWNDPAPRVAYEAGIHGVVPIVTDRGGLPQLVEYGRRGLIYDPFRPDTLLTALAKLGTEKKLLADIRQRWREVTPSFSPSEVALKTMEVYQKAVQNFSRVS